MQQVTVHGFFLVVLVLVVAVDGGCRRGPSQSEQRDGATAGGESRGTDGAVSEESPSDPVAYDADGLPLPDQRRLALGAAIPQGFKRLHVEKATVLYQGAIPPEKLLSFYQKYLHSPKVVQVKRGWTFHDATPRGRGDETRRVRVDVIKAGRRHSSVTISDLMGRKGRPGPAKNLKTMEDLHKAAHGRHASPKRPIPGTY
jgi:hypothetical protein